MLTFLQVAPDSTSLTFNIRLLSTMDSLTRDAGVVRNETTPPAISRICYQKIKDVPDNSDSKLVLWLLCIDLHLQKDNGEAQSFAASYNLKLGRQGCIAVAAI